MNIYVGNLNFDTTEDELRELFATHGDVASAAVIRDKITGRSRGFGFVEMADDTAAQSAITALNGTDFKGRSLTVNPARPREERSDRGRGGYSDRRGQGGQGGRGRRNDW